MPAELGRQRAQAAAVALAPDEAFVVRRDELPVLQCEPAVGRVVQQRVVERPGALGVDLVHARDEPDPVLRGDLAEPVRRRPRHGDGLAREQPERGLRARIRPAGQRARPRRRRVRGDERLREDGELRACRGDLPGQLVQPVERALAVEDHRLRLHARDLHRSVHGARLSQSGAREGDKLVLDRRPGRHAPATRRRRRRAR